MRRSRRPTSGINGATMRVVVIGNGMVGQRLLEQLQAAASNFEITVLCEESRPAYDRVHLTSYFSGKSAQELSLAPPDFLDRKSTRLNSSHTVISYAVFCLKKKTRY